VAPLPNEPDPKAQGNFTDPDSRIMKSKEGFVQAYNAQAAVDADVNSRLVPVLTPQPLPMPLEKWFEEAERLGYAWTTGPLSK
jgi:hypothetical protein